MEKAVDFCFRKGKAVGETSRPRVKRRKGEIQTKRNAMERKGKHTCQANQIKSKGKHTHARQIITAKGLKRGFQKRQIKTTK
jgi:hypothetical protein